MYHERICAFVSAQQLVQSAKMRVVMRRKVGTVHLSVYAPCACCGYSETGSCSVRASVTRRYAACCMGTKLKFSDLTRPGFYLGGRFLCIIYLLFFY